MSDEKSNNQNFKTSAISFILIIFESLVNFLLRFDKPLQERIEPLNNKNIILKVRTYLPHYEWYISFTNKGVLFDQHLPDNIVADVSISGSTVSISRLLMTGNEHIIRKLQFKGDANTIYLIQECISSLGMHNFTSNILSNLKNFTPNQDTTTDAEQLADYQKKITNQETMIIELNQSLLKAQQESNSLKKRISFLLIGFISSLIIFAIYIKGLI